MGTFWYFTLVGAPLGKSVRLLSVIGCRNLHQGRFQQLQQYMCRVGQPEGTPTLKGVYLPGRDATVTVRDERQVLRRGSGRISIVPWLERGRESSGVNRAATSSRHHSSCSSPSPNASANASANPWFSATGLVISLCTVDSNGWKETLRACAGVLAFDMVLCRHMHAEMDSCRPTSMKAHLASTGSVNPIANFALGSSGCAGCGRLPEGVPIWVATIWLPFPWSHLHPFPVS